MFRTCVRRALVGPSKEVTTTRPVVKSPIVSPAVVRLLYRSLLREVAVLDKKPIVKILFPVSKALQDLVGTPSPLYVPNGVSYVEVLKRVFHNTGAAPNVTLGFDTLTRLRKHNQHVLSKMPTIRKDHVPLMSVLKSSYPPGHLYRAEPLPTPAVQQKLKYVPADAKSCVPTKVVMQSQNTVELKEGVVLVAHPLSSTHVDRRVLLVTERNPHITTAVVLDLLYANPLSYGNPMFPEVFWGHDVHYGGYCHVDFTMPVTADVTILHTLPPTERAPTQYLSWLNWKDKKDPDTPQHHAALCRPIIRGGISDDGTVEPTLYASRIEAATYLASLASGQPRSNVRIFWGCMKWPTHQIEAEVANRHWIPITVSSSFFAPFPLHAPKTAAPSADAKPKVSTPIIAHLEKKIPGDKAAVEPLPVVRTERFPTEEELVEMRALRLKRYGVDVVAPQVFPPERPLCRRECLWDQLMFSLGGEYPELVGCVNPFSTSEGAHRIPPVESLQSVLTASAAEAAGDASVGANSTSASTDGVENDDDDDDISVFEEDRDLMSEFAEESDINVDYSHDGRHAFNEEADTVGHGFDHDFAGGERAVSASTLASRGAASARQAESHSAGVQESSDSTDSGEKHPDSSRKETPETSSDDKKKS